MIGMNVVLLILSSSSSGQYNALGCRRKNLWFSPLTQSRATNPRSHSASGPRSVRREAITILIALTAAPVPRRAALVVRRHAVSDVMKEVEFHSPSSRTGPIGCHSVLSRPVHGAAVARRGIASRPARAGVLASLETRIYVSEQIKAVRFSTEQLHPLIHLDGR